MTTPTPLFDLLTLERIEVNLFRGRAPDDGRTRIFGGHVIAQALLAAYQTVENRACHSVHGYFIRPGDPNVPILYEVDRARDGGSFTTRRVIAIQHGEQIFNLASSFQVAGDGVEHQDDMPGVPRPEALAADDWGDGEDWPIEVRRVEPRDDTPSGPFQNNWMRAREPLGDDLVRNQVALAFASDMALMGTAMRPHGLKWNLPGMQLASLDHAIWFHRPTTFNDWHLFAQNSPSASGGRGLNFGEVFNADGRLVASIAQEGLMRMRPPKGT
jgi:acyl-CoA thioesterase-2